eukprot:2705117-Amphidinium_carterae.1
MVWVSVRKRIAKRKARVLEEVRQSGNLSCVADEFRSDRDVVLAAVKRDGCALQHAAENLQGDHEVVLAAVEETYWALQYAAESLRGHREVMLAAVRQNPRMLCMAAD